MWACDVNGLIEVKPQKKTDPSEYVRNNKVPLLSTFLSSISLLANLPWRRKLFTVFFIIRRDNFFRDLLDSPNLYYDSRFWYNTVTFHDWKSTVHCNSFH